MLRKPEVSTIDTSERSAHSKIKVEGHASVSSYDQVVAVEEALQCHAHGSQIQMPGETNSQLPGSYTGSKRDNEQTETEDAPKEQTAVSQAARAKKAIDEANAWDTDEGEDL